MIFTVSSVRCLAWPTQASECARRRRNHGWPDAATVDRVLNNGCDLIHAVPRQYGTRRDKQMWRFSFSRAETELLNSWTTKQQTVHELFRFVVRKSGASSILDGFNRTVLKSYHLKTIMMRTCELMDSIWWAQSNVVQLVVYLMNFLVQCCESSHCEGYFVPNYNLFEGSSSESLVARLQLFTEVSKLSDWLIDNCIRLCADQSPDDVKRRFDDVGTIATLRSATSAFVKWKQLELLKESFENMRYALWLGCSVFHEVLPVLNGTSIRNWQKELTGVDVNLFPAVVTPLACLSALSTLRTGMKHKDDRAADILTAALMSYDELDVTMPMEAECNGSELLRKAIRLLRLSVDAAGETTVFIWYQLSHAYFRLAKKHLGTSDADCRLIANCYSACLISRDRPAPESDKLLRTPDQVQASPQFAAYFVRRRGTVPTEDQL
jgi:hypothetical protein